MQNPSQSSLWSRPFGDAKGDPPSPLGRAFSFLTVATGIYLAGWLTNHLADCGIAVAPCWVAGGTALVALILFGPFIIPAVWLGMFGLQMGIRQSLALAISITTVKVGAAVLGMLLLKKDGFKGDFSRTRDAFCFLLYGAGVAMFLSGGFAALILEGAGQLPPGGLLGAWWERWWMDALGLLLVGPPLLLSYHAWQARKGTEVPFWDWDSAGKNPIEVSLAWAGLVLCSTLALYPRMLLGATLPDILLLPFLVWIALRGSKLMASWAALWVSAVAISQKILLSNGSPLVSGPGEPQTDLWVFLATVAMITLLISTLRQRVADSLVKVQEIEVQQRVEDWSQAALDYLPTPLFVARGDGSIPFINQELTRQFGYVLEDMPTLEDWRNQAFPDDAKRAEALSWRDEDFQKIQGTGAPSPPRIYSILDKDRQIREVEFRMRLNEDRIICSMVDLTDRLGQLKEISRLNRFLSTLSEVNQCLVRSDSREELFRDICDIAVEQGGFAIAWIGWVEPETLQVVPVACAGQASGYLEGIQISARDVPEGLGPVGVSIRGNRPVVCNDILSDEVMAPWKDRAQAFALNSLVAIPIRKGGVVKGALVVYSGEVGEFQDREVALLEEMAIDISFALDSLEREIQRKRAEVAMRESETRLRLALEATGIGMWDWDLTRDVWYSTPTYFRMLGYEPSEEAQHREVWGERRHPEDRARVLSKMLEVRQGGEKGFNIEFRMRHADGSYRWINNIGHAIEFDGQGRAIRMLGLQIDITQRVELESQLMQSQKLEAIGQLAGGIAHDFNNILGAISGFVELATLKMESDDPVRHDLDQALSAAHRGASLTNSLLTFGRKQPMRMEPMDLSQVVAPFEKFLRRLIPEDIRLIIRIAPEPLPVVADRTQVEQVLMNLVTNARDAMPGGGEISIETRRGVACPPSLKGLEPGLKKECAILSVKDSGTGIPMEIQSKIYEPFFTTKDQGRGTGLGLATVYGIVERHGGFLELDSRPGEGSTFLLHLPLVANSPSSGTISKSNPKQAFHGTETLLLAEDDASVRLATATILRRHGYTVLEAADGQEAIDRFKEMGDQIHLVVLDGIMPRVDGWGAWNTIRALNPHMKAIFISGYSEDVFRVDGAAREGMEILQKPFNSSEILARVREVLDSGMG